MSRKDEAGRSLRLHQPRQKTDRRVLRTRERLGDALIQLIQEKSFDGVTVQDVLDRAGVGRSTFYVHYRDKDDLFMSDVDEFLEAASMSLTRRKEASERVAPVSEFFAHVREGRRLYEVLVDAGRIHDFMELAEGHFARGIERRLAASPRAAALDAGARAALAHALAGAMLSMLKWWIDRGMTTPPGELDDLFHGMVWSGVAGNKSQQSTVNS